MAAVSSQVVNKKPPIKNVIVIVLLLLVGVIFLKAFNINGKYTKSNARSTASVDCYRAEILMCVADISEFLPKSQFVPQPKRIGINSKESVMVQATDLLDKASAEQPENIVILCKKIILDEHAKNNIKTDLDKLILISTATNGKIISAQDQKLARLILAIYARSKEQSGDAILQFPSNAEGILMDSLSDGWYREKALLKIYKIKNQNEKYENLLAKIRNKTWHYIFKLALLGVVGAVAVLLGVIIILYQLIIPNKRNKEDKYYAEYGWQTVVLVFLSWFCTQIFMAYIANLLKQNGLLISYANSLSAAISIVLIYLFSNGPALLYIYFFAFKPNGVKLSNGLSLNLRTKNNGIIALAIIGLLGWLAAMPIVLAAYFISTQFFGSDGSNNPIIGIVMAAAQANDHIAILLFYFTLGVLAPLCEESLFRGFFYNYLRSRHGVVFSNILSSALFSMAHFDAGAALPLFCLGSMFAYLREKTGSILPSIIAHGIWNSATFTLVLILFSSS